MRVGKDKNGKPCVIKDEKGRETKASGKKNTRAYVIKREEGQPYYRARLRKPLTTAPTTDDNLLPVKIQQLMVAVYFTSRQYTSEVVQEMVQERVRVKPEPNMKEAALRFMARTGLTKDDRFSLYQIDMWLQEQMPYDKLKRFIGLNGVWLQQDDDDIVGATLPSARSVY